MTSKNVCSRNPTKILCASPTTYTLQYYSSSKSITLNGSSFSLEKLNRMKSIASEGKKCNNPNLKKAKVSLDVPLSAAHFSCFTGRQTYVAKSNATIYTCVCRRCTWYRTWYRHRTVFQGSGLRVPASKCTRGLSAECPRVKVWWTCYLYCSRVIICAINRRQLCSHVISTPYSIFQVFVGGAGGGSGNRAAADSGGASRPEEKGLGGRGGFAQRDVVHLLGLVCPDFPEEIVSRVSVPQYPVTPVSCSTIACTYGATFAQHVVVPRLPQGRRLSFLRPPDHMSACLPAIAYTGYYFT